VRHDVDQPGRHRHRPRGDVEVADVDVLNVRAFVTDVEAREQRLSERHALQEVVTQPKVDQANDLRMPSAF
jgi:hypothetical protein